MKIRILAVLLAALMLLSMTALAADEPVVTSLDETESTTTELAEEPAPDTPDTDTVIVPTETITPTPAAGYGGNSPWFDAELAEAQSLGLIPARFDGADLRVTMSRAEFAAVALLAYEKLSGTTVAAPAATPFSDTTDADVLRANAAGIVNGYEGGTFAPDAQVSRQQTATMLTRIFKATHWDGWTLAGDATYTSRALDYEGVALYADDGYIDDYALAAVYFLTKHGVAQGTGDNLFEPDAGCTREQGIALALRLYKAFG